MLLSQLSPPNYPRLVSLTTCLTYRPTSKMQALTQFVMPPVMTLESNYSVQSGIVGYLSSYLEYRFSGGGKGPNVALLVGRTQLVR